MWDDEISPIRVWNLQHRIPTLIYTRNSTELTHWSAPTSHFGSHSQSFRSKMHSSYAHRYDGVWEFDT